MTLAVELIAISKVYGRKKAVDCLSLKVPRGSILGFLGPNGAGKTTTIKLMLGLLRPDEGEGRILGLDMVRDTVGVRRNIGYVAEVQQMYGYMTVQELLGFCRPFYSRWNEKLVAGYLDMFQLPLGEKVKNLSKGMKTQLALVTALAPDPELLILDEPTSGLDPLSRQEFLRIILEEISVQGRTVFFSSHQLQDVERVADHVAIIDHGKLLAVKPLDELKATGKKIRVVFQHEPGIDFLSWPGVREVNRQGNAYLLAVDNYLPETLGRLQEYPHFTLEVIDQNLEEIFLDKIREERK
jgi:ABC-2 type transport system ATP-binding protein